jgi:Fe-S-cluster containining protein
MSEHAEKTLACPEECRAICCNYIVRKISPPRTKMDWDELYWFLCHERIAVYIEQRKWYLMVDAPCKHLTPDSLCRIYEERPDVCRLHSEESCENTGEVEFDEFMDRPEDLIRLMKKRKISYRLPWMKSGSLKTRRP